MTSYYNTSNDNITDANIEAITKSIQILSLTANATQTTTDQIQALA